MVYQSQTWSSAEETCERDGAKLAVPKTKVIKATKLAFYFMLLTLRQYLPPLKDRKN